MQKWYESGVEFVRRSSPMEENYVTTKERCSRTIEKFWVLWIFKFFIAANLVKKNILFADICLSVICDNDLYCFLSNKFFEKFPISNVFEIKT